MLAAAVVLLLGFALVLAARALTNHYVICAVGQRLVPTYALFQSGGHIVGLAVFLAMTPGPHRPTVLALVCFALYPLAALTARIICGMTDYWPTFRADPIGFILRA